MPSALRRQTLTRQERDAAVAQALLHLDDVAWLTDSPLIRLPCVQQRCGRSARLFAEGRALQACLNEAVDVVLADLDGDGALARWAGLLHRVRGGQSIAQSARDLGLTREYVSRTYWPRVVRLVAATLATLPNAKDGPYTEGRVTK